DQRRAGHRGGADRHAAVGDHGRRGARRAHRDHGGHRAEVSHGGAPHRDPRGARARAEGGMRFDFRYYGNTAVDSSPYRSNMTFSPDVTRGAVYFRGEIAESLIFREAISALHDAEVSELRWKPTDKTEYNGFAEERDAREWQNAARLRGDVAKQITELQAELSGLQKASWRRMAPFRLAQQRYFNYLWNKDRDAWYVLDPVITVHPDEVFFEC